MVLIAMAAGLYAIAHNTQHSSMTQAGVAFVIATSLAFAALAMVLLLCHSPWARQLFCRPCYYKHHKFHRLNPRNIAWWEPEEDAEDDTTSDTDAVQTLSTEY